MCWFGESQTGGNGKAIGARRTNGAGSNTAGQGSGSDGTAESDRVAGAAVARDVVATPHLRPAVYSDSKTGGGKSPWSKLFGFFPVR